MQPTAGRTWEWWADEVVGGCGPYGKPQDALKNIVSEWKSSSKEVRDRKVFRQGHWARFVSRFNAYLEGEMERHDADRMAAAQRFDNRGIFQQQGATYVSMK